MARVDRTIQRGVSSFPALDGAIPGQAGLFYYGPETARMPFGDGFRCVSGGSFRLGPPTAVDGAGHAQRFLDFTLPPADAGPGAIQPGNNFQFQFCYRDPPGTGGGGSNLSDGMRADSCE